VRTSKTQLVEAYARLWKRWYGAHLASRPKTPA
jgi:hypothetical protein